MYAPGLESGPENNCWKDVIKTNRQNLKQVFRLDSCIAAKRKFPGTDNCTEAILENAFALSKCTPSISG